METLLLTIVIILQFVLIFLIIQREYRLLPDGLVLRYQPQSLQDKTEREEVSVENLWDNPPTASEELKLTVSEFKSKHDRSQSWDGDFVL
jgi:hypothetical protein